MFLQCFIVYKVASDNLMVHIVSVNSLHLLSKMVCAMNLLFPKFLAITEVLDHVFFNPTNRYNGEKKLVISGSFCNVAGFRGQTITLFPLMPNLDARHAHVYKSKKGIPIG